MATARGALAHSEGFLQAVRPWLINAADKEEKAQGVPSDTEEVGGGGGAEDEPLHEWRRATRRRTKGKTTGRKKKKKRHT